MPVEVPAKAQPKHHVKVLIVLLASVLVIIVGIVLYMYQLNDSSNSVTKRAPEGGAFGGLVEPKKTTDESTFDTTTPKNVSLTIDALNSCWDKYSERFIKDNGADFFIEAPTLYRGIVKEVSAEGNELTLTNGAKVSISDVMYSLNYVVESDPGYVCPEEVCIPEEEHFPLDNLTNEIPGVLTPGKFIIIEKEGLERNAWIYCSSYDIKL